MEAAAITVDEVLRAGRLLFGEQFEAHGDWRPGLRRAFHRRALETHPDRAATLGRAPGELAREFQAVTDAFHTLSAFRGAARPPHRHEPRPPAAPRADAVPAKAAPPPPPPPRAARARTVREPRAPHREARPPRPAPARQAAPRRPWPAFPRRQLRFAEYLYYAGRVGFSDVVQAVAWQRRQRPNLGDIAVAFGYLTPDQVGQILERRRHEARVGTLFADFAVQAGFLTRYQQLVILGHQRGRQRPIGDFFVERGFIRPDEIPEIRRRIFLHNATCVDLRA